MGVVVSVLVFLLLAAVLQAPFPIVNLTGYTFCNTDRHFVSSLQPYILECSGVTDMMISGCIPNDLEFLNLQYAWGTIRIENVTCGGSLTFTNLQFALAVVIENNPSLVNVSFPQLVAMYQGTSIWQVINWYNHYVSELPEFRVNYNPSLASLDFPLFCTASYVEISNNALLKNITLTPNCTSGDEQTFGLNWDKLRIFIGDEFTQASIQSNAALESLTLLNAQFCNDYNPPLFALVDNVFCGLEVANN